MPLEELKNRLQSDITRIVAATVLAIGLVAGGWAIGHGFEASRSQRSVTVKGLAEHDVKADLALWPIRFVRAGNDLAAVQAGIEHDDGLVGKFLEKHGIGTDTIAFRTLDVTDRDAQIYNSGQHPTRFIMSRTIMVRSPDVDTIARAFQAGSELVAAGVVLSDQNGSSGGPAYLFNGLNALKPSMIAEATRSARTAAAQFARDSGSKLGGIVRANQGVFQILARDKAPMLQENQQIEKTVRVVSTLQYALVD